MFVTFSVVYDSQGMQIVCAIVSTLCFVLRETPENAEIIESIIFHESVDVIGLVNNGNVILRYGKRIWKITNQNPEYL